jgi:DNA-binding NarL/FixJ family response regulator
VNGTIAVAVVEEQEILRLGLVASLEEDARLRVVASTGDALSEGVDIAVVSSSAAVRAAFACPIVVCSDHLGEPDPTSSVNTIAGVLNRRTLTAAQLRATVHAAVAGLHVRVEAGDAAGQPRTRHPPLDPRARHVLEFLAEGLNTREIAVHLNYSERTIKKLITDLEHRFAARNRAQIVAQAIRRGLI